MLSKLKIKYFRLSIFTLVSAAFLTSCLFIKTSWSEDLIKGASTINNSEENDWDTTEEAPVVHDPLESYNRTILKINNAIFDYFLRPLSRVYDFLVPKKAQKSVNNVFSNAIMPVRFANNLFQRKFKKASTEVERFAINTTVGIGGLFDPANSAFNLEQHNEDFGQTLGYYGTGSGSYIMWPILGPSNSRDSIGFIVDLALNPLTWLSAADNMHPEDLYPGLNALNAVNNYSYSVRDNYDATMREAIDPYISLRNSYTQNRKKKISE